MKFAHLADCHIGGWREEELKKLSIKSFRKAVEVAIDENVGFVLISGDLFNTSLPGIELIKETASILNKLKERDISAYIIPGSHDYSPSGKTMLDVLEKAGLVHNVMRFKEGKLVFTEDKTGVKITGLYGRRSGLEKLDYESLDKKDLEKEKGFKIFMFHTTLEEFKPKDLEKVEGESYTSMPKGFNYYAGGHVHYLFDVKKDDFGLIVFPGPTFPNNFKELEELKQGQVCIVDDKLDLRRISIKFKDVESFSIDVTDKHADEVQKYIEEEISKRKIKDKIVTLRVFGQLKSGKVSDINFRDIIDGLDCYVCIRNINKLTTKEFEEISVSGGSADEIEEAVIKEHLGQFEIKNEEELTKRLMEVFSEEKHEGERNIDFEKRVIENVMKVLKDENK
ncbi:MAG: DNA repair exonuclease [Candidatus Woesearchaeota archaeon]